MQLLSVAQYARRMGVTQQAVYRKIKRGTLKTVVEKREVVRIPYEETDARPVN